MLYILHCEIFKGYCSFNALLSQSYHNNTTVSEFINIFNENDKVQVENNKMTLTLINGEPKVYVLQGEGVNSSANMNGSYIFY